MQLSAPNMYELAPGQWVRDQILLARPDFKVKDLDGDGTAGNIDDFIKYYEKNKATVDKSIPFFRWANSMDPGNMSIYNPIHDYLSLASKISPSDQIRDTYNLLGQVITGARIVTNPYSKAEQVFEALLDELIKEDPDYDLNGNKSALLILGAAHQFGLEASSEPAVNEVFLSYEDGVVKTIDPYDLLEKFYLDIGKILEKRGSHFEASEHYEAAVLTNPQKPTAYNALGRSLIKMKEYLDAVHTFNASLELEPNNSKALNGRGEAWYGLKQYPLALYDFRRAFENNPNSARAHLNLGRLHHLIDQKEKARRHFAQAVELDPQSADAYFYRARLRHDMGKLDSAMKDYKRASRLDRSLAPASYYHLGQIHYEIARRKDSDWYYKQARKYYSWAINSDWYNAKAIYFNDRGIVYHMLQKYGRAEWNFSEAIRRNPKLAEAWNGRALVRHDRRKYLKALADFDKAIELDPKYAWAYSNRADLYLDLKQNDKAFKDYAKAAELDPRNSHAHHNLGLIYQQKNKDIEALKAFTKAIKINPKRAPAAYFYSRGLLWYKLDKLNKAFDDFNKAIRRDKKHANAYYYRSEILRKWRQYINAQRDMSKACSLDNTLCLRKTPPDQPTQNKPTGDNPTEGD